MTIITKIGGRKFILSATILVFSFSLIVLNRLAPADYLKVTFAVIGLYAGLNVYQKVKSLGNKSD